MDGADRLEHVRQRLAGACHRADRALSTLRLIAVSKTRSVAEIEAVARDGVIHFGENRVQEAEGKIPSVSSPGLSWHLIGHLQKNKAKKAVQVFDWIHSIDSLAIASRIDRLAGELSRRPRTLVQVDLAGEATKSGIPAEGVQALLQAMRGLEHIRCDGLMVLPPFFEDPEQTRPYFRELARMSDRLRRDGLLEEGSQLSMGMSHDFEVAIEEGATMVRVGTAIFGPRTANDGRAVHTEESSQ